MPKDVDATWVNPASVQLDAGELRRADAAGFAGAGDSPLGVRGGIVGHSSSSLAVTVSGSDQVTVQPGPVLLPGNAVTGTGCYRTALPAAYSEALTARNATNPRIDLVVFRMLDTDVVGSHGAYTARIEVIPGDASGSPVAKPLPSMAVELGRINVPPQGGGSATVDSSRRVLAAAAGGQLVVASTAALPSSAAPWQRARVANTGVEFFWNGSMWVPVRLSGTSTTTGNGVSTSATVLFSSPFATPPVVQVTSGPAAPGNDLIVSVMLTAVSATQFSVRQRWSDNAAHSGLPFTWTATP